MPAEWQPPARARRFVECTRVFALAEGETEPAEIGQIDAARPQEALDRLAPILHP